jgi:hypothetical protein
VSGFQFQLTFNAQGQVTPTVGVGGALNIYFDWQKSANGTPPTPSPATLSSPLYLSLANFVTSMSSLIPELQAEAPAAFNRTGLVFDQYQVGIAVIDGVTVGLAQGGSTIQGKLIFGPNTASASPSTSLISEGTGLAAPSFINLINTAPRPEHLQMAAKLGVVAELSGVGGEVVYQVPRQKFKDGLKRALNIGAYFAKAAEDIGGADYQVQTIEPEFDASLTGQIGLVTVGSQGQLVLDFDRPGTN